MSVTLFPKLPAAKEDEGPELFCWHSTWPAKLVQVEHLRAITEAEPQRVPEIASMWAPEDQVVHCFLSASTDVTCRVIEHLLLL